MERSKSGAETDSPDLLSLVSNSCSIQASQTLGAAFSHFNNSPHDFIAVLEEDRLLGLCSRREVGMILGSRFGWELFGKKPVREHLEPSCIIIKRLILICCRSGR